MNLRFLLRSISNPAVKESLDDLPAGICCYWPGGLVKLKNSAMEQLSFALFDVSLLDGAAFWEKLSAGQGNGEYLRRGETPGGKTGIHQYRFFLSAGSVPVYPDGSAGDLRGCFRKKI